MRNLPIAYGNSRQAKTWVNKTTSFTDLKERLKVPIRTSESAEEYAKMTKADRDNAKDHGGFVFGSLIGGRRTKNSVAVRSGVCLWTALRTPARMRQHSIRPTATRRRNRESVWRFLLPGI